MMFCCFSGKNTDSPFTHNVEMTDKGVKVEITTDDKEKAKALKSMVESCVKLCDC